MLYIYIYIYIYTNVDNKKLVHVSRNSRARVDEPKYFNI